MKADTYKPSAGSEEECIEKNMGLVHSLASRFTYSGTEYEDLVQIGSLGLLKAIRNFDESRGLAFSTYAVPVIMGEIKKFLRDEGSIKISREIRSNYIKIRAFTSRFSSENGREATLSEISEKTGLTSEEIVEAVDAGTVPASLDERVSDDSETTRGDTLCGDDFSKDFERIALREGIGRLETEERKLVSLRFFCSKTQQETAEILGISQVQVSRREKKVLEKLKGFMF